MSAYHYQQRGRSYGSQVEQNVLARLNNVIDQHRDTTGTDPEVLLVARNFWNVMTAVLPVIGNQVIVSVTGKTVVRVHDGLAGGSILSITADTTR